MVVDIEDHQKMTGLLNAVLLIWIQNGIEERDYVYIHSSYFSNLAQILEPHRDVVRRGLVLGLSPTYFVS